MSSSPPRSGFNVGSGAAGNEAPSAPYGEVVSGGHGRRASDFTPEERKAALRQQQQRLLLLRHANKCDVAQGAPCGVTPHCQAMKQLWMHIVECKNMQCPTTHCVSSRCVLSHYHRCKDGKCAICAPVRDVIMNSHELHRARSLGTAALRQQQQRLLLLQHASKCDIAQGPCQVTPHCQVMKQLWIHIAECKNQQCPTLHCLSSRIVLSHYHRCKDGKCAICAPVRVVIMKAHERQRAMSLGTADL